MRARPFLLVVTAFSVACAALPSQSNDEPDSNLSSFPDEDAQSLLQRRGSTVSPLWYEIPSPTPTPEPKKNIPGAIGATIAAVFIVTLAVVIFLAHRGIWLRHLRAQQEKSKTVLSFRPTSTTPEPIEYDEDMRQHRSGHIVQSYISMETVCISDQDSEVGVPVSCMSPDYRLHQYRQHQQDLYDHYSEDTITMPLPVAYRHSMP